MFNHQKPVRNSRSSHAQCGVVLIMALIMLVVITMLATFSMRNSTSSEAVSSNVRTTELATQAAESALRYCEQAIEAYIKIGTAVPAPGILPYSATPRWSTRNATSKELTNWDTSASVGNNYVMVISSVVNGTSSYRRPPECMIEPAFDPSATDPSINTRTFIITARGFGPEVAAADASRSRPLGSEAWLQSTIGF